MNANGMVNMVALRQVSDDYNKTYAIMQKKVIEQRKAIKERDQKSFERKSNKFDVSKVVFDVLS